MKTGSKISLVIFFAGLLCGTGNIYCESGQTKADSLEVVLARSVKPEEKIRILLELSVEFTNTDLTKAMVFAKKANMLAESEGDDPSRIATCLRIAMVYFMLSDLNMAMDYAVKAKGIAEAGNLDAELAQSRDAIGSIYYDIGDQTKSSENFYASLKIYEMLKDKEGLGGTFCRIGTLYLDQKDYDKALDYYQKSIKLAYEIKSEEGIASNLNNLGKVYSKKLQYDKALKSFNEALTINLARGDSYLAGYNYLNIADVYLAMKQFSKAINSVEEARSIFEKLGNKLRLAKCQVILSEIYLETDHPAESEASSLKALEIAQEHGYRDLIVASAGMLNRLYLANHDSVRAFRYFILEKQYRDSLFLDEKQKTLTRLELQYQFEKNERILENARQRKNVVIFIISGCLIFSVIIIVLILKQLRLKAKKQQLEKENFEKELEFKNKELVLNVMSLMKKNEMLADLSEKLIRIDREVTTSDGKNTIQKVAKELQKSQEDEIWKEFSLRFKEVHGEFYDKLLSKYPTLTPNDLKLCAFLRLNMSSKDIAALTGQRVSSLETARYRLRQKLGIANSESNLIIFLSQF